MKRPYEKPTLIDLSLPTARAGRLPGGVRVRRAICSNGVPPQEDPAGGRAMSGCSRGIRRGDRATPELGQCDQPLRVNLRKTGAR